MLLSATALGMGSGTPSRRLGCAVAIGAMGTAISSGNCFRMLPEILQARRMASTCGGAASSQLVIHLPGCSLTKSGPFEQVGFRRSPLMARSSMRFCSCELRSSIGAPFCCRLSAKVAFTSCLRGIPRGSRRSATTSPAEGGESCPARVDSKPGEAKAGQAAEPGVVHFVATPIGNLQDITLRAMNVLQTADIIAAEDTRTTGSLLKLIGVQRTGKLLSHHDHNLRQRVPEIVAAARSGKSVAVVSDAGTPGISDPGMELAAACAKDGLKVVPVPGACAAVAAVSVSGFPSQEFVFFGFVSGKRGSAARRRKLQEIAREPRACVMYESPYRIADTLRMLLEASRPPDSEADGKCSPVVGRSVATQRLDVGDEDVLEADDRSLPKDAHRSGRPIVLARELTKLHEEIFRGSLAEAVARYGPQGSTNGLHSDHADGAAGRPTKEPKGEFTVVLGPLARDNKVSADGYDDTAPSRAALEARLLELIAGGMSTSSAVKMASKDLGLKKSEVYRVALALPSASADEGA